MDLIGEGRGATGLAGNRQARQWSAAMIAPACDPGVDGRASYVAKSLDLATVPASAVLHISAQGLYRAFINGVRVGDDLLTPGLTCYDDRLAYQSYDISGLLKVGQNRVEIWLADGWYRSQIMWEASKVVNCWGDRIAAIAELETDGHVLLRTGADWVSGLLPITRSGIYYGEDYDARLEDNEDSTGVEVLAFDTGKLVEHETAPVKELAPFPVVETWQDEAGRQIVDFGQNCSAQARIIVRGETGASVLVEYAEVLGPGRAYDRRNYRGARAALKYTLKGDPDGEIWQPAFTFCGYRYARLTISGKAEVVSIVSVPVSSVPVQTAGFSCGVHAVNQLVENTIWSQRSNFIEIPTDCPQRDERLGWTGDAQVFSGTACWLANSERFLAKFLRNVMHDQRENGAVPYVSPDPTRLHPQVVEGDWAGSTGWGDAITVIPWQIYLHYGNKAVLAECFGAMTRWVDYLWSISDGPIIHPNSDWGGHGFSFGDWLQPIGDNRKPRPTIGDDCAATLYHFISTDIVAKVAGILGRDVEASAFRQRANAIKTAFAREYISATGRLGHNDQTSYALAFLYGLIPEEHQAAAKLYFQRSIETANFLIGTGFIGTPALLPALTRLGCRDLAEKVFLNRKVPGWLYQVEHGATTIWERWDAIAPDGTIYDPDMNSYNHYAYGAVCQWLFEDVAGLKPVADAPGFEVVELAPQVLPALGPVFAWHECRLGRLEAGWSVEHPHKGGEATADKVTFTVLLPKGTTGRLRANPAYADYQIDGASVTIPEEGMTLASGRHSVTFTLVG